MLLCILLILCILATPPAILLVLWIRRRNRLASADLSKLKGKVILITGCSSGIGEQLAYAACKHGAKVVITARSTDKLETVALHANDAGGDSGAGECVPFVADLYKKSDCIAFVDFAVNTFKKIDYLILNHAWGTSEYFQTAKSTDLIQKVMDTNFMGYVNCAHATLAHLLKSKGSIVYSGSGGIGSGVPYVSAYHASKHAIQGFFDSVRCELGPESPITITNMKLGLINTPTALNMLAEHKHEIEPYGMHPSECADLTLRAAVLRLRECDTHPVQTHITKLLAMVNGEIGDAMMRKYFSAEAEQ